MRKLALAILFFFIAGNFNSDAQCRRMAKKCIPNLKPYIFNGQLNKTTLDEGESADLVMSFQAGQKYRIQVCGQDMIGHLDFKVTSQDGTTVFDNSKTNWSEFWDFEVKSTQNLTISVTNPVSDRGFSDMSVRGCVAVLVGFLSED